MQTTQPTTALVSAELKCCTCRHAVPSSAYPKLSCLFRQEYVEPHDHCVRFQVQPTQ